uniref:Uncharacterized protein n=1 Tax=Coccolithus braarudii TaxID=221442 RepID=A0A7S0LK01_9EUKA
MSESMHSAVEVIWDTLIEEHDEWSGPSREREWQGTAHHRLPSPTTYSIKLWPSPSAIPHELGDAAGTREGGVPESDLCTHVSTAPCWVLASSTPCTGGRTWGVACAWRCSPRASSTSATLSLSLEPH